MSRLIFVTVSDDRFKRKEGVYEQTQTNVKQFLQRHAFLGVTDYLFLTWEHIRHSSFYAENKDMLDDPDPSMNGRCYKPYAIVEALKMIDDGDYLIYNDVSPELWREVLNATDISPAKYNTTVIKELCTANGGVLTAAFIIYPDENAKYGYHTHEHYTLERCMNRMALKEFEHSLQHTSAMIVLQKSKKTEHFANEWLHFNVMDECASLEGMPRTKGENFWQEESVKYGKMGHRHDQSISGLLINQMGNRLVVPLVVAAPYNFINFCCNDVVYETIDSNYKDQTPTKYHYKTLFNRTKWETVKLLRQ